MRQGGTYDRLCRDHLFPFRMLARGHHIDSMAMVLPERR